MRILIVEDEFLAAERLKALLLQYDSSIEIAAVVESISQADQFFKTSPLPNLIFCDIHLGDGLSFEIFDKNRINVPIVFTTAYDGYALKAFKTLCIDYLLKPISLEGIAQSMNKYRLFVGGNLNQKQQVLDMGNYKTRFLGRIGTKLFFLESDTVACFFVENKVVFMVDNKGNKYIVNHPTLTNA
jgi:two-component system, LytTR family, response regulator LytT